MIRKHIMQSAGIAIFFILIGISYLTDFDKGMHIGGNFIDFLKYMLKLIPCAYILIGLFEVWVKKETIERHFGEKSGIMGYIWAILLAATTFGGMLVAFPLGYSLYCKGSKLSVIFTYLGASAICRIPMAIFEASFLGIKFTSIRLFVSLPLIIISSLFLEKFFASKNYTIIKGK